MLLQTSPYQLRGILPGPLDSVWHGAWLHFDIVLSTEYPLQPPSVQSKGGGGVPMLHTRVAPKGQVCVSLLRERPEQGEGMGTKGDEGWWHPDISLKAARGQLGAS